MAPVLTVTPNELRMRRQQILERLGVSLSEYRRRAGEGLLDGAEWEARDDLEIIAFLLGEAADID